MDDQPDLELRCQHMSVCAFSPDVYHLHVVREKSLSGAGITPDRPIKKTRFLASVPSMFRNVSRRAIYVIFARYKPCSVHSFWVETLFSYPKPNTVDILHITVMEYQGQVLHAFVSYRVRCAV